MQFTKLFLSLIAVQQCDASGDLPSAGAIAAKATEAIAGKTVGAVVGGVTDIAVNLNPWAAGVVAVTSVSGVVYKYQG